MKITWHQDAPTLPQEVMDNMAVLARIRLADHGVFIEEG